MRMKNEFKKIIIALVTIAIAGLMGACSTTKSNNATNYTPKELNVQFVPSVQGSKLQDRVKPLKKLLKKQLGIPARVSVSTSNTALVEAMSSKKVDVGFIGGGTYVLAHKKKVADVLLRAMNEGYDEPSGRPNNKKMSHYRSMIVVKKGSKIKTKDGKNVLYNIYNHLGYVDAKDSDFDIVRKSQKDANKASE